MNDNNTPNCYRFSQLTEDWSLAWSRLASRAATAYFFLLFLSLGEGVVWWIGVSVLLVFSLCVFAAMRFAMKLIRDAWLTTTYSIESDFLTVNRMGLSRQVSIELGSVTGVTVGSARSPETMRMHIEFGKGNEIIIQPLKDMGEFVSEIERRVPVDVSFIDDPISPLTRNQKYTAICMAVGFLIPLIRAWAL
ncbi:MAG: hypothetical protein KF886_23100 [Candidatus Hydrogenedentes bacterium]|nr:hypothetical protein [Candidatus Hydrogenedentota bacterium]